MDKEQIKQDFINFLNDYFNKYGYGDLEDSQYEHDLKNSYVDNYLKNNKSMSKEELLKILEFTELKK